MHKYTKCDSPKIEHISDIKESGAGKRVPIGREGFYLIINVLAN